MAKLNYKYGVLAEDGSIIYAPYRLHYGRKYVINASESKYRACGYFPIVQDSTNEYKDLADNQYLICLFKYENEDDDESKYIQCYYEVKTLEK